MEDHGLIARDVALLKKAQGIGANKSFILYFVVAAIMVVCTLIVVFAGGVPGIGLLVGLAVIGAIARFTTFGENLIIVVVLIISMAIGALAVYGAIGSVFS